MPKAEGIVPADVEMVIWSWYYFTGQTCKQAVAEATQSSIILEFWAATMQAMREVPQLVTQPVAVSTAVSLTGGAGVGLRGGVTPVTGGSSNGTGTLGAAGICNMPALVGIWIGSTMFEQRPKQVRHSIMLDVPSQLLWQALASALTRQAERACWTTGSARRKSRMVSRSADELVVRRETRSNASGV